MSAFLYEFCPTQNAITLAFQNIREVTTFGAKPVVMGVVRFGHGASWLRVILQ
jgi:hypothetical protein